MSNETITLKAENLRKTFNGSVAVDNFSVGIEKGEIYGLLGPNGAGKTTLIRMITGLLKPDSGRVLINGSTTDKKDNRQSVGLCPQDLVLWNNLTCIQQLVFIAEIYNVPGIIARRRA